MNVRTLIGRINANILNPLILLVFSLAFVIFFWGLFQFIQGAGEAQARELGKKKIIYGLIGMFIMFSAYGLIRLVTNLFGIPTGGNFILGG